MFVLRNKNELQFFSNVYAVEIVYLKLKLEGKGWKSKLLTCVKNW